MNSRVSIVVPSYNNADYIERTMTSVLTQTYPDLEIVVADHSSTDDTWARLQQYSSDPRVTLLQTSQGGGALANWNRASQAATGEYLKLVCGDDLIYPELVAEQVAALDANPGATLTASARDIIDANDQPIVRHRGLAGLRGLVDGRTAIRRTVVAGSNIFGEPGCVMMRRAALQGVGWWDSSFPYLIDETTYARVLMAGDFFAVDRSLAGFRISDSQWSVRLAGYQSEQAAGFHRWLYDEHPGIISRFDLARGDLAAGAMAVVRRVAYVALKRRMKGMKGTAS